MYFIPCVGGPLDGAVQSFSKRPKDGSVFSDGMHGYEFSLTEWTLHYYRVRQVRLETPNGNYIIRYTSQTNLARQCGYLITTGTGFTWCDAACACETNRMLLHRHAAALELIFEEGR